MATKVDFDTTSRLIICHVGVTELDVKKDLYSDGKEDWLVDSELNKFIFPIYGVGGNPTVGTQSIEPYFFLRAGWQIRPYEADHNLIVSGNLFVEGGGNPFVPTLGDYTVSINQITTITNVTTIGADEVWKTVIENDFTAEELLRLFASILVGKTSIQNLGGGNAIVKFKDLLNTKDRVTAQVSGSERTNVLLDGT